MTLRIDSDTIRNAPLDGVIVVALEQAIAAPIATRHLVDLGARVVKIEHPDGGDFARGYDSNTAGQSTYFVWANRGKDSLVLDIKSDEGRDRLEALIAGADVFIQNLSAAAAERAGLLAAQLVARHPRLIACDISGYGLGGPRTDDKAYDLAIQSEAGAVALTGSPEQMSKVGVSIADIASGMYALSSILSALYRRDRTGEGAAISLSMLECLAEWTSPQVLTAAATGVAPARSPRRHPMIAPYGMFELRGGRTVLIAVQADREWRSMAEHVLLRPELGTDARFATNSDRIANVDELEAIVTEVFGSISEDEAMERLATGRITVANVSDPIDVWNHEQLAARDRKVTVTTETGAAEVLRAPFNLSGLDDRGGHVPALGEHDAALVDELLARTAGVASPRTIVDALGDPAALVGRFLPRTITEVHREFPNGISHSLTGDADRDVRPSAIHPAFHGCYDWHSAVHSHWQLVRAIRLFPGLAVTSAASDAVDTSLSEERLRVETEYVAARPGWEMPYGMAWLLRLAAELHEWDDERADRWRVALGPLEAHAVAAFGRYLDRMSTPVRTGLHNQSAFSLGLVYDYAVTVADDDLAGAITARAVDWFGDDRDAPVHIEPSGTDFLSPVLAEADLMRRVLPADEFARWFDRFVGNDGRLERHLQPVGVVDHGDGQLAHFSGSQRQPCLDARPDRMRRSTVRRSDRSPPSTWTPASGAHSAPTTWCRTGRRRS